MPFIEYLIKFSLWIAATWLFYRLLLSQLTFYRWNRLYLLCYTLFAFVVPFLDLSKLMRTEDIGATVLVDSVPAVTGILPLREAGSFTTINIVLAFLAVGAVIMAGRLLMQVISFRKVSARAVLLHQEGEVRIYGSDKFRGAFSFGNAIYLNHSAHSQEELQRILLHEIVHVKQKHTFDLILCEILCVVNWFNPFAWMLRKSVKQNLEFIADEKVVSSGADRKQYQYLLLKITASPALHIVNHLTASNLKKRIAMMNKMKSAQLNLSRFLFTLPLLAVVLLAFRSQQNGTQVSNQVAQVKSLDTVPRAEDSLVTEKGAIVEQNSNHYNEKGYALSVITTNGESMVVIRDQGSKKTLAITMDEWNRNRRENERKYGKLPPPPPPPPAVAAPAAPPAPPVPAARESQTAPAPPPAPEPPIAPPAPPVPPKKASRTHVQTLEEELQEQQVRVNEVQQVQTTQLAKVNQQQAKLAAVQVQVAQKQAVIAKQQVQINNQVNQNKNIHEVRPVLPQEK